MLVIYLSSAKGKAHSFKTYSNKSFNAIIAHPCEHWSRGLCQSSLESKGGTLGNLQNSFSLLRESLCSVFAFSFFLLFFFFLLHMKNINTKNVKEEKDRRGKQCDPGTHTIQNQKYLMSSAWSALIVLLVHALLFSFMISTIV